MGSLTTLMMIMDFPSEILDLPCDEMHWLSRLSTKSTDASRKVPLRNSLSWSSYHAGWIAIGDWEWPWHCPITYLNDEGWIDPWIEWTGFWKWGSRYSEMPDEMCKDKLPQYRLYVVLVVWKKSFEGQVCYWTCRAPLLVQKPRESLL